MSERWVLVPETFIANTFEAGWAHSGEGWNAEHPGNAHKRPYWFAARDTALAARPPVSREWLDAAVERAVDAMTSAWCYARKDTPDWHAHKQAHLAQYTKQARAAILAALEMTDG